MKKVLSLFLFVFSFVFFFTLNTGQTFAEQWISVGNDIDGYEWFYDADSVLAKNVYLDKRNVATKFIVVYKKVHPNKATWYKGDLVIYPENRTASTVRWEKHKKGKSKYSYWTYDEDQEYYTTSTMFDSIGLALLRRY